MATDIGGSSEIGSIEQPRASQITCSTATPQHDELLELRRELSDFSRSLRGQLRSYEQRQEQLLARLERGLQEGEQPPPPKCVLDVSLESSDIEAGDLRRSLRSEPGMVEVCPSPDLTGAATPPSERRCFASAWSQQASSEPSFVEGMSQLRGEKVRAELGESLSSRLGTWIDWWLELREPKPTGRLAKFVLGRGFEALCTLVVVANSALIVYTTNWEAHHLVENEETWLRMVNAAMAAFYSLELVLRLSVHKFYFFCNDEAAWNVFDLGLVSMAVVEMAFSEAIAASMSVTHLRTVRAIRILRAAKALRIFRLMRFFAQLRVLLSSVLSSLVSLFWGMVMLAFVLFIFALIVVQGATFAQMQSSGLSAHEVSELQSNLGSTESGMLMLLQSTTGGENWGRFYNLIQLTGEWNCGLFLSFIAFVQIALLNILTGIFVENALKQAQPDRDTAALQQRKEELVEAEELRRLIASMDTTHSGVITEEQFLEQLKSEQFRARLALLGLEIRHAELFFQSVCTDFGRREVSVEAFVAGAMRLKGSASALDLQTLTFGTKLIHENQIRFEKAVEARLLPMTTALPSASQRSQRPPASAQAGGHR